VVLIWEQARDRKKGVTEREGEREHDEGKEGKSQRRGKDTWALRVGVGQGLIVASIALAVIAIVTTSGRIRVHWARKLLLPARIATRAKEVLFTKFAIVVRDAIV